MRIFPTMAVTMPMREAHSRSFEAASPLMCIVGRDMDIGRDVRDG